MKMELFEEKVGELIDDCNLTDYDMYWANNDSYYFYISFEVGLADATFRFLKNGTWETDMEDAIKYLEDEQLSFLQGVNVIWDNL